MARTTKRAAQPKTTPTKEVSDKTKMDRIVKDCTTTSSKIRSLTAAGYKKGAVAKYLGKSYQHVRNVLITPVANPVK